MNVFSRSWSCKSDRKDLRFFLFFLGFYYFVFVFLRHGFLESPDAFPRERIEFYLDEGEPIINVTKSLKDEGHKVLKVAREDGYFKVLVEKR